MPEASPWTPRDNSVRSAASTIRWMWAAVSQTAALRILEHVRNRRAAAELSELANEFWVSGPQVRRDLQAIEDAGFALDHGRGWTTRVSGRPASRVLDQVTRLRPTRAVGHPSIGCPT